MEHTILRLPHVGEMIYRMKHEDKVPFTKIPLITGETRREILRIMEEKLQ
jgi:cobalt/nickel transport system ATP-binding protein